LQISLFNQLVSILFLKNIYLLCVLVLLQEEYAINAARIAMSAQDQQSMTVKPAQICTSS